MKTSMYLTNHTQFELHFSDYAILTFDNCQKLLWSGKSPNVLGMASRNATIMKSLTVIIFIVWQSSYLQFDVHHIYSLTVIIFTVWRSSYLQFDSHHIYSLTVIIFTVWQSSHLQCLRKLWHESFWHAKHLASSPNTDHDINSLLPFFFKFKWVNNQTDPKSQRKSNSKNLPCLSWFCF